jgi:ABC-type transporter Mla maintaining outer membrane lipid asymmetry ATPase subunit MlaF
MSAPTATSNLPAIEMRGVAAGMMRDPGSVAVEEINWSVAPGDFWVVAGAQGSGKSDFLMMAGGLVAPVRGAYHFFGEGMPIFEDANLAERLRLGFVFDGGQLFNHLTVFENIALPLRYHRNLSAAEAETGVRQMLEWTGLEPWADSTPGAMGRNWRKRAGLARALMLKPEVLLLDNPLTGLDFRQANWWQNFLEQLNQGCLLTEGRPVTLVVTAEDLRPWRNRERRFAVLKGKRLVVLGNWAQVEAASAELVHELMVPESPGLTAQGDSGTVRQK